VDLPVPVLDGDGKRGKVIGLMLSRDGVGWVDSVAELDGGKCDLGHLISSKSVAVAVNFITETGGHGPTFDSCRCCGWQHVHGSWGELRSHAR